MKLSDFSDENASVRAYMTGDILDVHVHRDAASFVKDRVAGMVQQSKSAVARCAAIWTKEHAMISNTTALEIGEVPASAKAAFSARKP